MTEADLDEVLDIERASFPTPWSRGNFEFELRDNPFAGNVVIRERDVLSGYACFWIVDTDLRLNNIAIAPASRGRGLGARLLEWVIQKAVAAECEEVTLEVRPSNAVARKLYETRGFLEVGRRRGYYQDTGEDAVLMALRLR
jgi:ribosomal-protein-alanine N-acetyltransferase